MATRTLIRRIVVFALGALLLASNAVADKLILTDGREIDGEIIKETSRQVTIKAHQGAIVTTLTFRRYEIASIERGEVANSSAMPITKRATKAPALVRDPAQAKADPVHYMLIPIKGVMGEEALASGIEKALARARRSNIDHIVFEIDTPGGYVHEATSMVEQINAYRDLSMQRGRNVKFYAYVRNAISAGIWVIFACDEIVFDGAATAGGAVIYTPDHSTGEVEVDAKMNSIIAAKVASVAEQLGHNRDVVRAMMIMEAELWAQTDPSGEISLLTSEPDDGSPNTLVEHLDTSTTILTLTAAQAQRIGVGAIVPGGPEALGEHLGIEGWTVAGNFGEAAMAQAKREADRELKKNLGDAEDIEDFTKKMDELNDDILPPMIDRAERLDPARQSYSYYTQSGMYTPESRRRRLDDHDRCIGAWRDVLKVLKKMDDLDKRFKRLTGEYYWANRGTGRMIASQVDETIDRLFLSRRRNGP